MKTHNKYYNYTHFKTSTEWKVQESKDILIQRTRNEEKIVLEMAKELSLMGCVDPKLLMQYLVLKNKVANTCI